MVWWSCHIFVSDNFHGFVWLLVEELAKVMIIQMSPYLCGVVVGSEMCGTPFHPFLDMLGEFLHDLVNGHAGDHMM